jgi:CheY-like chemotaxis protein/Tfp pilus assembly protein PilZ
MNLKDNTILLDEIREYESQKFQKYVNSRTQPRFIPTTSEVTFQLEQPQDPDAESNTLLVNLSKNGACIATNAPLNIGAALSINLITNNGRCVQINGTVTWCNHFNEQSHESGIIFNEPIDTRCFVSAEIWNEFTKHSKEFQWNTKRQALVINNDPLAFNVVKMLLKNANISPTNTRTPEETQELLQQSDFDLILITDNACSTTTESIITSLRSQNYTGPILVESASRCKRQSALLNAGATAVLQRPIQLALLLSELRDAIQSSQIQDPRSLKTDTPLPPKQCDDEPLNESKKS